MVYSIATGVILSIATIVVHALCTSWIIHRLRSRESMLGSPIGELKIYTFTGVSLLLTHLLECSIWAVVYVVVVGPESISGFGEAIYFSAVSFASLGYGDIVIENHWRLLSAIQAMTGLLVFGWSTALFFAVVQRVWRNKYADENHPDRPNHR